MIYDKNGIRNTAQRVTLLLFHFVPLAGQKFHTIRLKKSIAFLGISTILNPKK